MRSPRKRQEKENMSNNKRKPFHKKRFTPDPSYVPPYDASVLGLGLDFLKLGEEVAAKLTGAGITTVMDVVVREEKDFYRIYSFDKKNLGELKSALNNRRLRLKPAAEVPPKPARETQSNELKRQDGARPKQDQRDGRDKNREGAPNERQNRQQSKREPKEERREQSERSRANDSRSGARNKKNYVSNPDGVSEKRTKEEREARRPKRPKVEHPVDRYIKINKNNKWGFATRDGKEVIKPEYDDVFTFKEDMCCVESEDAFGFIDREGKVVIPLIYECASSFSEGLACVFKGGTCGYINKEGNTVIPFVYDAGTAVTGGECRVKKAGKWGELHIADPDNVRWIN